MVDRCPYLFKFINDQIAIGSQAPPHIQGPQRRNQRHSLSSPMVITILPSKQIATGSNDSMVFVWNLNSSGNIFKYIGHRVSVRVFRMRWLMLSSHLWEINLQVHQRMRLLRSGPTTLRETPLPSRLITLPFEHLITAMMGSCCWHAPMIRQSRCIALKIKNFTSRLQDTRTGSRQPTFLQIIDWSAQVERIRLSYFGIHNHRRFCINSMTTWARSTTASSTQTAHA